MAPCAAEAVAVALCRGKKTVVVYNRRRAMGVGRSGNTRPGAPNCSAPPGTSLETGA
jgi:hypothetical protein